MSSSTTARLVDLVKRYPVAAGIGFVCVGLVMIRTSLVAGAQYAEFAHGERTVGQVLSVDGATADVAWAVGGVTRRAAVQIVERQAGVVRGSELPLVLSTVNPEVAISAQLLSNHGVVAIGGRSATYLIIPGLLILGSGVLVALLRNGLVGEPSEPGSRRRTK